MQANKKKKSLSLCLNIEALCINLLTLLIYKQLSFVFLPLSLFCLSVPLPI